MRPDKERKKAMIRQYKGTPKTMGAYCIRNTQNQKAFVGISRDVDARLNRHRFNLRNNSEDCAALQRDLRALGADAFEFEVLEVLEPPADDVNYDPAEDLESLKLLWCEQLHAYAPAGYTPQ